MNDIVRQLRNMVDGESSESPVAGNPGSSLRRAIAQTGKKISPALHAASAPLSKTVSRIQAVKIPVAPIKLPLRATANSAAFPMDDDFKEF
jgi:hypothetical protein